MEDRTRLTRGTAMDTVRPRSDGRTADGRFGIGNQFSQGNALARRQAVLKAQLLQAVGPEAIGRVAAKLVELAESGDVAAIRTLLDHTCGKPAQAVQLEGLEAAGGASWG